MLGSQYSIKHVHPCAISWGFISIYIGIRWTASQRCMGRWNCALLLCGGVLICKSHRDLWIPSLLQTSAGAEQHVRNVWFWIETGGNGVYSSACWSLKPFEPRVAWGVSTIWWFQWYVLLCVNILHPRDPTGNHKNNFVMLPGISALQQATLHTCIHCCFLNEGRTGGVGIPQGCGVAWIGQSFLWDLGLPSSMNFNECTDPI